jgi:hypothetical protein
MWEVIIINKEHTIVSTRKFRYKKDAESYIRDAKSFYGVDTDRLFYLARKY